MKKGTLEKELFFYFYFYHKLRSCQIIFGSFYKMVICDYYPFGHSIDRCGIYPDVFGRCFEITGSKGCNLFEIGRQGFGQHIVNCSLVKSTSFYFSCFFEIASFYIFPLIESASRMFEFGNALFQRGYPYNGVCTI